MRLHVTNYILFKEKMSKELHLKNKKSIFNIRKKNVTKSYNEKKRMKAKPMHDLFSGPDYNTILTFIVHKK